MSRHQHTAAEREKWSEHLKSQKNASLDSLKGVELPESFKDKMRESAQKLLESMDDSKHSPLSSRVKNILEFHPNTAILFINPRTQASYSKEGLNSRAEVVKDLIATGKIDSKTPIDKLFSYLDPGNLGVVFPKVREQHLAQVKEHSGRDQEFLNGLSRDEERYKISLTRQADEARRRDYLSGGALAPSYATIERMQKKAVEEANRHVSGSYQVVVGRDMRNHLEHELNKLSASSLQSYGAQQLKDAVVTSLEQERNSAWRAQARKGVTKEQEKNLEQKVDSLQARIDKVERKETPPKKLPSTTPTKEEKPKLEPTEVIKPVEAIKTKPLKPETPKQSPSAQPTEYSPLAQRNLLKREAKQNDSIALVSNSKEEAITSPSLASHLLSYQKLPRFIDVSHGGEKTRIELKSLAKGQSITVDGITVTREEKQGFSYSISFSTPGKFEVRALDDSWGMFLKESNSFEVKKQVSQTTLAESLPTNHPLQSPSSENSKTLAGTSEISSHLKQAEASSQYILERLHNLDSTSALKWSNYMTSSSQTIASLRSKGASEEEIVKALNDINRNLASIETYLKTYFSEKRQIATLTNEARVNLFAIAE